MTTFDFSIYEGPPGRNWSKRFGNSGSNPKHLVGSLERYGLWGWDGHRIYSTWVGKERLASDLPDWCLHVARCTRRQLTRLADACLAEGRCDIVSHAAFLRQIDMLAGSHFVVCVREF